ncbi:cohesin domain-containing protein [Paenibacillus sp. KS-LC4]|uniref:cohesin domain-containing protein n=1 Tax=Paenibacillus sp. KS-LC4 TaxID=2979727 RepID=UPI0030CE88E1
MKTQVRFKTFFMAASLVILFLAFQASAFAATVGSQLNQPEAGWKRYDQKDAAFNYMGRWTIETVSNAFYGGTQHDTAEKDAYVEFSFTGTKLRLILSMWDTTSTDVSVIIDGENQGSFSQVGAKVRKALWYEKTDLEDTAHTVRIINNVNLVMTLDAVDIDENGTLFKTPEVTVPAAPQDLVAAVNNVNNSITLNWNSVSNATKYNVQRSTIAGGPYTSLAASVSATSFSDTSAEPGKRYYYVVTALNTAGESQKSNEVAAELEKKSPVLKVTINENTVKLNDQFTSYISLENVSNIYAEDFTISYDAALFEYVGFEEIAGYKVFNEPTDKDGTIRFIVASQGEAYGINEATTFLKLNFKAKAMGTGKVDAVKCRIADTINEYDLDEAGCTEDSVTVSNPDVNRSGAYTLVDLAIVGYYHGKTLAETDTVNHVADQTGDGFILNDDLVYVVNQMLNNPNYSPNN